jgi:hypothetical protein
MQDSSKTRDSSTTPVGTRRFSRGIFEVVYDYPKQVFAPWDGSSTYRNLQSSLRFFRELNTIAPRPLAIYALGCLWMSVSPALSLYLSYVALNILSVSSLAPTFRTSLTANLLDINRYESSPPMAMGSHCSFALPSGYLQRWYRLWWIA